jgi:hypothetical protein
MTPTTPSDPKLIIIDATGAHVATFDYETNNITATGPGVTPEDIVRALALKVKQLAPQKQAAQ